MWGGGISQASVSQGWWQDGFERSQSKAAAAEVVASNGSTSGVVELKLKPDSSVTPTLLCTTGLQHTAQSGLQGRARVQDMGTPGTVTLRSWLCLGSPRAGWVFIRGLVGPGTGWHLSGANPTPPSPSLGRALICHGAGVLLLHGGGGWDLGITTLPVPRPSGGI